MTVMDIERPVLVRRPRGGRGPVPTPPRLAGPPRPRAEESGRHRGNWEPLAGDALLQRLRITGRPRPEARPELSRMLRNLLEAGLGAGGSDPAGDRTTSGSGPAAPAAGPAGGPARPVLVTKDRLTRVLACDAHQVATGFGDRPVSVALACGALVDVLFRQLVTVGSIGDPMEDGLAALAVDDHQADLLSWVERLAGPERDELRAEVERQAEGLRRRWPTLDAAWLPRTQETMRARSGGGTVELSARVDLVIGRPARHQGSVALVEVKSGSRRVEHRADLHFYALVEALRSPAPPFAVATYYSRTGELDVDPVTDELLVGAARRTAIGARRLVGLARGIEPDRRPGPLCAGCSVLPAGGPGPWPAHALGAAGGDSGADGAGVSW